ncbi:MAG TPA: thiol reductant ABC exporter subunit CydC [Solirubrobacteraceae bacterium]|jgi:thiol reductant ABC exporter CydC subunit|nr:thiol reductant ABC exporter subunit CydC [Solirubrobacteraceae bacterium]
MNAQAAPLVSPSGAPTASAAKRPPEAPLRQTLAIARPAAGRLVLATLLGAGSVAAAIGLIATSAWLISRSSQRPPESAVAVAIVGVQFFALSRGLCRYFERLVGHDAAFRVMSSLRVSVYERLERLAPLGLPAFRSGELLSRLVQDVDSLQDLLLRVVPPFAIALLVGAGTVALVWWMLPAAAVILLVALLLAGVLVPWLTGTLAAHGEALQAQARGEMSAAVVDLIDGAPELVAYGAAPEQLQRTLAADADLTRIAHAGARTAGIGQGLTTLCSGLTMWGALLVGVSAVRTGRMDGVLLAGIALIPLVAFELVSGLPAATQTLQRVRRAAARVQELRETPPPVIEPEHPQALPAQSHTLTARNLSCSYPGASRPALEEIDLDLSPGRRVALVGPSGAGKSTLAAVLLRFLPYEGSVALDGVEIDALDGDAVRRVVGLVSQDVHIFDSTLEENLRLAKRDASEHELRDALAQARLLDWVDSLPLRLATEVGERGARMSGGQRQRLALARALLADFPILILDEPGEHLDTDTADALVADILDVTRARTTLLITHRLVGLEQVDEILVIEHGGIVERGTHAQLTASAGRYAASWQRELSWPGDRDEDTSLDGRDAADISLDRRDDASPPNGHRSAWFRRAMGNGDGG